MNQYKWNQNILIEDIAKYNDNLYDCLFQYEVNVLTLLKVKENGKPVSFAFTPSEESGKYWSLNRCYHSSHK